jgi:O-antigen ligase
MQPPLSVTALDRRGWTGSGTYNAPVLAARRSANLRAALTGGAVIAIASVLLGYLVGQGGKTAAVAVGIVLILLLGLLAAPKAASLLLFWTAASGILYPFIRYPWHASPDVDFDRIALGALLVALPLIPRPPRVHRAAARLSYCLALFAVLYGLRAITTGGRPPLETFVDSVLLPCALFWVASRVVTSREMTQRITGSLAVLGSSVAVLGIAEWLLGFQLATWSGGTPYFDYGIGAIRVSGPFSDPWSYGAVLVFCIAATYYWWKVTGKRVGLVALIIELIGTVPSFTKTTWVGAILVLIAAAWLAADRPTRLIIILARLGIGLTLLYILFGNTTVIQERVFHSTANLTSRFGEFIQGWHIFISHIWWGVGVDNFVLAQQAQGTVYVFGQASTVSAHNNFVKLAAENGLSGLVPYLMVILATVALLLTLRRLARNSEERLLSACLAAAAVAYLAMSMVLALIYVAPPNLVLALLLGVAAGRLNGLEVESGRALEMTRVRSYKTSRRQLTLPAELV